MIYSARSILLPNDTKLFGIIKQENNKVIPQKDIDELVTWSDTCLLTFNPDKCKVINIGAGQSFSLLFLIKIPPMCFNMLSKKGKKIGVILVLHLRVGRSH